MLARRAVGVECGEGVSPPIEEGYGQGAVPFPDFFFKKFQNGPFFVNFLSFVHCFYSFV